MSVIMMVFLLPLREIQYMCPPHDTDCAVQDGSGEIDLEELRTVMTSLGYSPTDKQLEDMMAKVCIVATPVVPHSKCCTRGGERFLSTHPFTGKRCIAIV